MANPDCSMRRAPRVDSYRGFVFASLAADGPSLLEFLGEAKVAFDDMCDRAPEGEVEVVTGVNLPMVIKLATQTTEEPLAEIAYVCGFCIGLIDLFKIGTLISDVLKEHLIGRVTRTCIKHASPGLHTARKAAVVAFKINP